MYPFSIWHSIWYLVFTTNHLIDIDHYTHIKISPYLYERNRISWEAICKITLPFHFLFLSSNFDELTDHHVVPEQLDISLICCRRVFFDHSITTKTKAHSLGYPLACIQSRTLACFPSCHSPPHFQTRRSSNSLSPHKFAHEIQIPPLQLICVNFGRVNPFQVKPGTFRIDTIHSRFAHKENHIRGHLAGNRIETSRFLNTFDVYLSLAKIQVRNNNSSRARIWGDLISWRLYEKPIYKVLPTDF